MFFLPPTRPFIFGTWQERSDYTWCVPHHLMTTVTESVNGFLPLGVSVVLDCVFGSSGQVAGGEEISGTGIIKGNEN